MELVLDLYDDPTASILASRLQGKELPAKLASAALLSQDELGKLPDRLFALVASYGDSTLRKFAMHDDVHLSTSIAYFMETKDKLPFEMQQKVAANLVNACAWYDATPPEKLVKVALIGALNAGLGLLSVPDKLKQEHSKSQSNMDSFRAAQASGTKVATGRTVDISQEEERRIANSDMPSGHAWKELEQGFSGTTPFKKQVDSFGGEYPNAFDGKIANVQGTELGLQGALKNDSRMSPAAKMAVPPKTAEWQHAGTFVEPTAPRMKKLAQHYALPHIGQYPLDSTEQVKQAALYFEENYLGLTDMDRRMFACSVAQRAEDLGVKIAGQFLRYSGAQYGDYIDTELRGRISAFEGTAKTAAYAVLLAKRAEIAEPVMVEMLKRADKETGVDQGYGRVVTGFREPYRAVYEKLSADHDADFGKQFSWTGKGHHVSEETLNLYSVKSPNIDNVFGEGFSIRFARDPVKAFASLSDDEKVLLSRLANAQASRTP